MTLVLSLLFTSKKAMDLYLENLFRTQKGRPSQWFALQAAVPVLQAQAESASL